MEPRVSCEQAIRELRAERSARFGDADARQILVVLSYLVDQQLSGADFARALQLMAESASRGGRPSLAAAARAVLDDWLARMQRSAGATGPGPSPPAA